MRIYSVSGTKLTPVQEEQFTLERQIQRLTEANLEVIFSLEFVRSEFDVHGLRIDTLAFDRTAQAFVIIEYKKDRDVPLIDQGMAYLSLMVNNPAEFILEYINRFNLTLTKKDVDWTQSRVIFVAPEFTKYQQHAIGFKDFAIQLFEVHLYMDGLLVFNEIKPPYRRESISAVTKDRRAKKISEVIKVYSEDDLLIKPDDNVKELYSQLRSDVMMLGNDIEVRPTKKYIAFRRRHIFLGVILLNSKLKAYLNIALSQLRDPLKKGRDVKNVGHNSPGDTELTIAKKDEIPYLLALVKQAYEKS